MDVLLAVEAWVAGLVTGDESYVWSFFCRENELPAEVLRLVVSYDVLALLWTSGLCWALCERALGLWWDAGVRCYSIRYTV